MNSGFWIVTSATSHHGSRFICLKSNELASDKLPWECTWTSTSGFEFGAVINPNNNNLVTAEEINKEFP